MGSIQEMRGRAAGERTKEKGWRVQEAGVCVLGRRILKMKEGAVEEEMWTQGSKGEIAEKWVCEITRRIEQRMVSRGLILQTSALWANDSGHADERCWLRGTSHLWGTNARIGLSLWYGCTCGRLICHAVSFGMDRWLIGVAPETNGIMLHPKQLPWLKIWWFRALGKLRDEWRWWIRMQNPLLD